MYHTGHYGDIIPVSFPSLYAPKTSSDFQSPLPSAGWRQNNLKPHPKVTGTKAHPAENLITEHILSNTL